MLCYHITPSRNVRSILTYGIEPTYSRGRDNVVWLCTNLLLPWAYDHVRAWQETADLTLLKLYIDRRILIRRRRGVWQCKHVILPEHIKGIQRIYDMSQALCKLSTSTA